jgi:uncharacterized membrane protein (UPF0136 family)
MRLNSFVTPLTIGLCAVVFLTGVLMFFHIESRPIKGIHEYFGLVMVATIALHLINHKKATIGYFKKSSSLGLIAAIIVVSGVFYAIVPEKGGGDDAQKEVIERTLSAPVSLVANLFELTSDQAIEKLAASGVKVSNANETLSAIARNNRVKPDKLIEALIR